MAYQVDLEAELDAHIAKVWEQRVDWHVTTIVPGHFSVEDARRDFWEWICAIDSESGDPAFYYVAAYENYKRELDWQREWRFHTVMGGHGIKRWFWLHAWPFLVPGGSGFHHRPVSDFNKIERRFKYMRRNAHGIIFGSWERGDFHIVVDEKGEWRDRCSRLDQCYV